MWTNILISHIPRRRIAVSSGNSLLEELPDSFPKQLYHFTVPLAVQESSSCSVPLPGLGNIYFHLPLNNFFWAMIHSLWLVPQPGIELSPSAVKAQSLNHWTTREFPKYFETRTEVTKIVESSHVCTSYLT